MDEFLEGVELIYANNTYQVICSEGKKVNYNVGEMICEMSRFESNQYKILVNGLLDSELKATKKEVVELILKLYELTSDTYTELITSMIAAELLAELYSDVIKEKYRSEMSIREKFDEKFDIFNKRLITYKRVFYKFILHSICLNSNDKFVSPLFSELAYEQKMNCRVAFLEGNYCIIYKINSLMSLLAFEIANASAIGTKFIKCKNCGEYFVKVNRSDEMYCSRSIFKVKGDTCRDVGAQNARRHKELNDLTTKSYRKVYGKYLTHLTRHPSDDSKRKMFERLTCEVKTKRKLLKEGQITEEDFMTWLSEF